MIKSDALEPEIDSASIRLYFISRDRSVLGLMVLLLLIAAVGTAWLVRVPEAGRRVATTADESVAVQLKSPNPDAAALLSALVGAVDSLPAEIESEINRSALAPDVKLVASAVVKSGKGDSFEPCASLFILAHQPQPAPGVNLAVARLFARADRVERAHDYLRRELSYYPSESVRGQLIDLLAQRGQLAALMSYVDDPEFAVHFSDSLRLKLALRVRQWTTAARMILEIEKKNLNPRALMIALIAALAWLIIVVQSGQPLHWLSYRTVVPVVAVMAGLIASWPAHLVSAWQDQVLGLRETGEFLSDVLFCLGQVAPREVLIKLIFTLPFVPVLLARRSPLEMLVVSGGVGLGFAIEGNLRVYQTAGPAEAFGRLLTANFFHFACSGLLGLALCRFLKQPVRRFVPFLATLLGIVAAQGVYDAFMNIPGLRFLSAASVLSFFVIAQIFFGELRRWRDPATDQLFLASTLVLSLTILAGATLVCASMELGFYAAISAMGPNAIGLAVVVAVLFRQLQRKLSIDGDPFLVATTP